jgi:hypothetical protein
MSTFILCRVVVEFILLGCSDRCLLNRAEHFGASIKTATKRAFVRYQDVSSFRSSFHSSFHFSFHSSFRSSSLFCCRKLEVNNNVSIICVCGSRNNTTKAWQATYHEGYI